MLMISLECCPYRETADTIYLSAHEHLSFFARQFQRSRRWYLSFLGRLKPSNFARRTINISTKLGAYLLMDYAEKGVPFSFTWMHKPDDQWLRANLLRGLARVLLALSRAPLTKIGAFAIDDNGLISLGNRPLTVTLLDLENEGIPVPIPRGQTFSFVYAYVNSLLSCHNNRLEHQPNAVVGHGD